MDASRALMVEGHARSQLVAIDLSQSWDGFNKHLPVVIMLGHWVVCQVDRGQRQSSQVLLVLIGVFQVVPIHP